MMTPALRCQLMCNTCAYAIHGGTISAQYADAVARLLFMTIAHESDSFKARRQYGFRPDTTRGAFGWAQTEKASMDASFDRMWLGDAVGNSCVRYLDCWNSIKPVNTYEMRMAVQKPEGDALSVLLCRLHYLRVAAPVPLGLVEQSEYAKYYYNTRLGKAKPSDYLKAYQRHWPGD
jgi:hypothetical protein